MVRLDSHRNEKNLKCLRRHSSPITPAVLDFLLANFLQEILYGKTNFVRVSKYFFVFSLSCKNLVASKIFAKKFVRFCFLLKTYFFKLFLRDKRKIFPVACRFLFKYYEFTAKTLTYDE